jgi:prepilin-type N-terminal cleavage/methylation domain-containing protein
MKSNQGFTLIETMVALLILGILGLMASQGLGGAFRVKDSVEGQIKEQDSLVVMLKHLQNDCEAMVKNADEKLPPTFVQGNTFTWLMRHYSSVQANGWQFVGYVIENNTLKRYTTPPFSNKQEAVGMLAALSKDSDLGLASAQLSYQLPQVIRQKIEPYWSSYTKRSAIGLQISLSLVGNRNPLTSSCIAEGKL